MEEYAGLAQKAPAQRLGFTRRLDFQISIRRRKCSILVSLLEAQGKTKRTIREGRAFILLPPEARTKPDPKAFEATYTGHRVKVQTSHPAPRRCSDPVECARIAATMQVSAKTLKFPADAA